MSELICPRTQLPCAYGDFCAVRKEDEGATEGTPPASIKELVKALDRLRNSNAPPALMEAQRSSYCSEERIRAVGVATAEITASDDTNFLEKREAQKWAVAIAGGIITERECHKQVTQPGSLSELLVET